MAITIKHDLTAVDALAISLSSKSDIARVFSLAAPAYDKAAFIQKEIGQRLLQRLQLMKIQPQRILDLGSGTGFLANALQQQFPKSQIIGVDIAQGMCRYAKRQQGLKLWGKQPRFVCGDSENLPFANGSFDVVFSNLSLPWCHDIARTFDQCKRVLNPKGMLLFSTLGPNTLQELRAAFATVDNHIHVNAFIDMHDIGDALLNTHYTDPVVDMELLTVSYASVQQLLQDLKATGAHNLHPGRRQGLLSKRGFEQMVAAYDQFAQADKRLPATVEVIYGHAQLTEMALYRQDADGCIKIPGDKIPILA